MMKCGPEPRFRRMESGEAAYPCLVHLPASWGRRGSLYPLLLCLHGSGERGRDLEQLRRNGVLRALDDGLRIPFVVAAPQCPPGRRWSPATLLTLLDTLVGTFGIDADRVCVTGLSMGGYGTWALAAACPERLAAIAPICGGGSPRLAGRLVGLPIWAFHGARDDQVALRESTRMVDAVNRAGGRARLTVYPEAGHDSWTRTYRNPALYRWLQRQRRAPG